MAEKEPKTSGKDADILKKMGQSYSKHEQELITELTQLRLKRHMELEYETLEGYEVPPPTQFSMLKKPSVVLKYNNFTCNKACINLFEGVRFILPMVNGNKCRLIIAPCREEESGTVEWAKLNNKQQWVNRTISSPEFIHKIFKIMAWNPDNRYKVLGRISNSPRGLILMFDLNERVEYTPPVEVIDKETGEIKKRSIAHYPERYTESFGKDYKEYAAANKLDSFEMLDGYSHFEDGEMAAEPIESTTA